MEIKKIILTHDNGLNTYQSETEFIKFASREYFDNDEDTNEIENFMASPATYADAKKYILNYCGSSYQDMIEVSADELYSFYDVEENQILLDNVEFKILKHELVAVVFLQDQDFCSQILSELV